MSIYHILVYMAIAYYVGFYTVHTVFLALGYRQALRWKKLGVLEETQRLSTSELVPPVSLVAELDTSGEEAVQWVDDVLSQRFPEMEVMVIYSGTDQDIVDNLVRTYFLRRVDRVYKRVLDAPHPREVYQSDDRRLVMVLADEQKRGSSLNMALNLARYPLVAVAGNGVNLEEDALLRMARPFMMGELRTPAVMGVALPLEMEEASLPPRRITRFSLMESLRIQLAYQAGAPSLGGPVATYSPLLVFRKIDLLQAGGFGKGLSNIEAETDIILRLHRLLRERRRAYHFAFLPQLVSRYPFARTWMDHFREYRERRRGIAAALWSERDMIFKARYGLLGILYIPVFWLFIQLMAVMEILAYAIAITFFALGEIGWAIFGVFLASSLLYPALVGMGAVFAARRELGILGGHGALLYGYAFLTQLWFRQLTGLASLFVFQKDRDGKDGL
jgi:hypothetical protein